MSLSLVKDIFETLSFITVIVGFPMAIWQYRKNTLKEQADREYGTYNALDEKYLEFLRFCFENPHLDVYDIPDKEPSILDPEGRKRELIAFTMLISIFERAYLMYHDQSDDVRSRQWTGWHQYMRDYCKRRNFRSAWDICGEQFDDKFKKFMDLEIRRSHGPTSPASSTQ
jgi:hypothetical protein